MTNQELSNYFDTLVGGYYMRLGNAPQITFDEYEKSIYLTDAQEDLVITLYKEKAPTFEGSEDMRRALASIVKECVTSTRLAEPRKMGDESYVFALQDDVWFIVYESVDWSKDAVGCLPNTNIQVVPITHDEYHRIKKNPFRGTSNDRVLRLDIQSSLSENQSVELISKYPVVSYRYRYLRRPKPIILEDISTLDGISIDGQTKFSECELPERLHRTIVEYAVQKAIASRSLGAPATTS